MILYVVTLICEVWAVVVRLSELVGWEGLGLRAFPVRE